MGIMVIHLNTIFISFTISTKDIKQVFFGIFFIFSKTYNDCMITTLFSKVIIFKVRKKREKVVAKKNLKIN